MSDDDGFSSDEGTGGGGAAGGADYILRVKFNQAVQHVQNETVKPDGVQLPSQVMLNIYGLYKVATIGKCKEPKPGLLDQKGRAKWTAWTKASDLTKAEAMAKYIDLVSEQYFWAPEVIACSSKGSHSHTSSSVMGGNAVSTFAMVPEDSDDEGCKTELDEIFSWVKDNNFEAVEKWLKNEKNDPNAQDKEGLTLLHWSVDRGHIDLCRLLLRHGSDPNIPDLDGDTALDFATTCDHVDIVRLLSDKVEDFSQD